MSFILALGVGDGNGDGVGDGVGDDNGVTISINIGDGVSGVSVGNGVAPHSPTAPSTTLVDTTTIIITSSITVIASVDPTHNFNYDRPNLGTIIGIVIGIAVVILILIGGTLFFFLKRRGLLHVVQSSGNRASNEAADAESSSLSLEGVIQSAVLSTSEITNNEITNNVTITGTTPELNLISDTTPSSNPSSNPNGLLHDSTSDDTPLADRLTPVPRVPQLLTTGGSDSQFRSVATGRSREAIVPDSSAAVQTPVSVLTLTAPAPNQRSPPNPNSSLNYNITMLPHHSDERWHTDSGVRVDGGTLAYEYDDGSSSQLSIRSKDRFPPLCMRGTVRVGPVTHLNEGVFKSSTDIVVISRLQGLYDSVLDWT